MGDKGRRDKGKRPGAGFFAAKSSKYSLNFPSKYMFSSAPIQDSYDADL